MKSSEKENKMTLTFQRVNEIFETKFGLLSKTRKRGNYVLYSYYFADKYLYTRKKEVAREVTALLNGGVGGYIYVGHLPEYDTHPKRHKDGYLNIKHMLEPDFIDLVAKVVEHYK